MRFSFKIVQDPEQPASFGKISAYLIFQRIDMSNMEKLMKFMVGHRELTRFFEAGLNPRFRNQKSMWKSQSSQC